MPGVAPSLADREVHPGIRQHPLGLVRSEHGRLGRQESGIKANARRHVLDGGVHMQSLHSDLPVQCVARRAGWRGFTVCPALMHFITHTARGVDLRLARKHISFNSILSSISKCVRHAGAACEPDPWKCLARRSDAAVSDLTIADVTPASPIAGRVPAPGAVVGLRHFDIIVNMKSNEAIAALSALASEPRLAVFRLLVKRGPAGYTPTELTQRLGVPAPTLSFHLRELVNAGLVASRREGRNLHYRAQLARMQSLLEFLTENCCSLADEACGPDCQPLPVSAQVADLSKQKKRA